MQDILNADHPTKIEEHERYMLVVAKFFRGGEEMQVCLVQGTDFVLSFIESESPLFDDIPQAIRNNVLKFRSRPSDYLLSVLLNSITANYATLISKLDGDLDDLETGLLSTTDCRDTAARFRSCATATSNSNRPPCPCATSTRNCSTPTRRCFTRTCAPSSTT